MLDKSIPYFDVPIRRDPWVHWVAVKPSHRGLGLGKALVAEGMRLELESPDYRGHLAGSCREYYPRSIFMT